MDTIIVKPKSEAELQQVLDVLQKMNVPAELYRAPSKDEVLASVEKGAEEAAAYIKGRLTVKEAKDLLNEL